MSVLVAALLLFQGEKEVKHPITGVFKGEIKDPVKKDVIMRVAMQAPSKVSEQKTLGLLVLHHGFNGNENNYFGGAVDCAKRLGLTDQYVIIAGKSRGAGWAPADDEYVLRLVAWAKETYPIDPRRVYIWGSSNGAAFVGRFGWANLDKFAAVIGYCGSYNFQQPPGGPKGQWPPNAADAKTEWYFVHGGDDNPQNSRKACDELKARGFRTIFRQLDGYGHTDIWDGNGHPDKVLVDAVRDDWFLWIHSLRHKEIAPAADEKKTLAAMKIGTAKADAAAPMIAEAARIGGVPGGKAIDDAFTSTDAEVKAAATKTTEKTLYGREIVLQLIRLLRDKSDEVRAAAVAGLGVAANYRYAEAQEMLIRTARSRNGTVDERVAAVQALGRAVKLMLPGNFEDKAVFWTMVLLLDDDDLKVREAAFAQLEKGVKDSFEYKPDLPTTERKTAVGKWKSWAQTKAGPAEAAAVR